MKMKAQIFWFVLMSLISVFSTARYAFPEPEYFTLEHSSLIATEGSCAELKCLVRFYVVTTDSIWFWMKNAKWDEKTKAFKASTIYSSNTSLVTVSPAYARRVKYIGSSSSTWNKPKLPHQCSILICNLEKEDIGTYQFRFEGQFKWVTQEIQLSVTENPCPLTFEQQPVINENDRLNICCTTLVSCPQSLQLLGVTPSSQNVPHNQTMKTAVATIIARWEDDGREISCQTENNKDPYLVRTINLTVEYAPKNVIATVNHLNVNEGQMVTFACSARGRPYPTFKWFSNGLQVSNLAQWNITSIATSQNGTYCCIAQNTHGTASSQLHINIHYKPEVEVKNNSPDHVFKEGDVLILYCFVKKSNPMPYNYTWYKNGKCIGPSISTYNKTLEPDDGGSYKCAATNTAGTGGSSPIQINVHYRPRRTKISITDIKVKVGQHFTLSCVTDANPVPEKYSWHSNNDNKNVDSKLWSSPVNNLTFGEIQREDESCYTCRATNAISEGDESKPICILVHYPPTNLQLDMNTEATEGDLITINCTVESFPLSQFTLTRKSEPTFSPGWNFQSSLNQQLNKLSYTVIATAAHTGFYTCNATNTEGSLALQKKLAVKYAPKNVTVQPEPGLLVNEHTSLTLHCTAKCHPEVISFTWMKMIDEKSEILQNGQTITLNSITPSDSGAYSCAATNEIGTGNSQQVRVQVIYGPKQTEVRISAEMQQDNGRSFVTLTCHTQCYPLADHFSWYKKAKGKGRDVKMSDRQMFTVFSDEPGIYYCIAKNEINERESELVPVFVGGSLIKFLPFLTIPIVIILILFVYRYKRNTSFQQNTNCCFALMSDGNCGRINHPINPAPSRSRDDLLPDQLRITEAQQWQPHPESTNQSFLNLHPAAMTPTAQPKPATLTEDISLNYTTLQFGNKQKARNAKEEAVYTIVSKKKSAEKNEERELEDYENFSAAQAVQTSNPLNDDTSESSDDEIEVCYTQVNIVVKPSLQGHSSKFNGEETLYSDIRL